MFFPVLVAQFVWSVYTTCKCIPQYRLMNLHNAILNDPYFKPMKQTWFANQCKIDRYNSSATLSNTFSPITHFSLKFKTHHTHNWSYIYTTRYSLTQMNKCVHGGYYFSIYVCYSVTKDASYFYNICFLSTKPFELHCLFRLCYWIVNLFP